jgi:hypothetical protein
MQEARREFTEWWITTEYGRDKEIQKAVQWDSERKKAVSWPSFHQVAHAKTGEPKVMCKACHAVVIHPGYRRAGTSPMKTHLKSGICVKPRTLNQDVSQQLRNQVCFWTQTLLSKSRLT